MSGEKKNALFEGSLTIKENINPNLDDLGLLWNMDQAHAKDRKIDPTPDNPVVRGPRAIVIRQQKHFHYALHISKHCKQYSFFFLVNM